VRPLLSDRCFPCHGPDPGNRQAGLRLDLLQEAAAHGAIVPGEPRESELLRRIGSSDPDERMPPPENHRPPLDEAERELLARWIAAGAPYEEHWAFQAPQRPALPRRPEAEIGNAVDAFVRARLDEQGLEASPPARPELLLRRLFLDLTGLPPTPEELDAFLAELEGEDFDAIWSRWIAKLFVEEPYRSRYAERMASPWLDQARYADTSGIHMDAGRQIWPWRDWVLRAFRDNMPFDRFLTEQLAGDLLPDATLDQQVASGFNRNHVTTDEGGAIDAEYLVEYAADRVETTASVFLGVTMQCARCHDHKFDPLTQEDYYGLFAFFFSNDEPGLYSQIPDPNRAFEPFLEVPSGEQVARREELDAELEEAREAILEPSEAEREALVEFRNELPGRLGLAWAESELVEASSSGGATLSVDDAGVVLASGESPDTDVHSLRLRTQARDLRLVQLDVLGHEGFTNGAPGRAGNGNAVLTGIGLEAISVAEPERRQELALRWLWADADQDNEDWSLLRALDERPNTGWAIAGHTDGSERVALLLTEEPFGFEGGTEIVLRLEYESIYADHVFGRVRVGLASLGDSGLAALPLVQGHWYQAGPFDLDGSTDAYERRFGPEEAIELDLAATFVNPRGGVLGWAYRQAFVDGAVTALEGGTNVHYLAKEVYAPEERSVELSLGSDDGFALFVNGREVARNDVARGVAADQDRAVVRLEPGRNSLVLKVTNTGGAAGFYYEALEGAERLSDDLLCALVETDARADHGIAFDDRILHAWRLEHSPDYAAGLERIGGLEEERAQLEAAIPRTMVMREREEPRETYVLERGLYDHPDESRPAAPSIPGILGTLDVEEGQRATRLDLARWMTDPGNPLVARVAANRLWQLLFGTGLVATSGDFGYQGAWPSHPELLDWLAVELVENGWDLQALLTTLLASDTYRQDSAVRPEHRELDPENRWLARYPRRRLEAEALRDQALYVAGLLVERFGGPSVKPYHPPGLWREVAMLQSNTRTYERGEGDELWRRSLYTYWKRACSPPSLLTFDAPTREACVLRRARTNTPLQALVLWNDEQYVEAARLLAERTLGEERGDRERLAGMFRRCTSRWPSEQELDLLAAALADHRERYRSAPEDAAALVGVGERGRDGEPMEGAVAEAAAEDGVQVAELAAWTLVANALLNLHATITQG